MNRFIYVYSVIYQRGDIRGEFIRIIRQDRRVIFPSSDLAFVTSTKFPSISFPLFLKKKKKKKEFPILSSFDLYLWFIGEHWGGISNGEISFIFRNTLILLIESKENYASLEKLGRVEV